MLPRGIPRRSFILLAGGGGTGKSVLTSLIAWHFAREGEPVIYVALDDDPLTVLEGLSVKGYDASDLLERRLLTFIDGYSSRYGIEPGLNVEERLATLDPTAIQLAVRRSIERRGLKCKGLLVIDSLNALLLKFEPTMVMDFVNAVRAYASKLQGVVTVATLHTSTQLYAELASSLEHMVDVVIWLKYHAEALEAGYPVREILVKKAKGAPVTAGWLKFIITDKGVVEVETRTVKQGEHDSK